MATALTIPLDERGSLSLQQQLYTRLRDDILARRLRPGERLPPSRALAVQLAVSRTTVVLVYDQLVAEGYAEARQGAGTMKGESEATFLLVELGIPGLLVALILMARVLGLTIRIRSFPDREVATLLAAIAAGVVAIAVLWLVGAPTAAPPLSPFFWFAAGTLAYWLAGRRRA